MSASLFSLLFLSALCLGTVLHLWLQWRQICHVRKYRTSVPAEFAESIPLESHQRSADYTLTKSRFTQVETLFEALLLLVFTQGGIINWLDQTSRGLFSSPIASGLALIVVFALLNALLMLPFAVYSTFSVEAHYGFNNITPRLFILDQIKTITLATCIGLPLITLILWLMEKMGNNWWLWVWLTWVGFSVFLMLVFPTWIAPLFNKFSPLEDQSLKTSIENLLARCGFKSSGVFVMDGSRRSNHGNAYFTGLGKSKRIVFFDTLLKQLDEPEILAVLAHELGHFRHRHVVKRLAWTFTIMLGLLWLLGQLMHQAWFYQGLGVTQGSTAVALLLFFLVLPVFSFIFAPIGSWLSRRQEFEADAYAAKQAQASDLVAALVKLYRDNASTLTPDPLYSMYYYTHPPATIRIAALKSLG
ncbi:MAG: M48 family metallopeptidase [Formivibrio sp.]|nr:M48 family metallopeptidase [Formivibrio sp.]